MAATRRQAPDLPAGGAADKESDYDKLIGKIRAKTAAELAEADAGAKLTAASRWPWTSCCSCAMAGWS